MDKQNKKQTNLRLLPGFFNTHLRLAATLPIVAIQPCLLGSSPFRAFAK